MKTMLISIANKMIADVKAGYSAESSAKDIYLTLTNNGFTPKGANLIIEQVLIQISK